MFSYQTELITGTSSSSSSFTRRPYAYSSRRFSSRQIPLFMLKGETIGGMRWICPCHRTFLFLFFSSHPRKDVSSLFPHFARLPCASFEMKSIPFESVHRRIIPIDYEWMRNLYPAHEFIHSEGPIDSVRLRFILFQSKLMSQVHSEWFRIDPNEILILFKSV